MRTQLVTLAAALTLAAFATTATAATAGSASGGGSSGGGGGFSTGSSGGGSSSSSGAGSSSSSGGGGSSGGSSHGGSSGGGSRGGEFGGRSNFNGYRNSGSQGRDFAHGGYRVLDTRPAMVVASTAVPLHGAHGSMELGPRMGSAAKAERMSDDKRRVLPVPHPGPIRLHHVSTFEHTRCARFTCAPYRLDEMCPHWLIGEGDHLVWTTPLYCGQPVAVKLRPGSGR
jgi:hypothetical protein